MLIKKDKHKKLDAIKLFEPEKEDLDFPSLCRFIRKTLGVTQEEMAQKLSIAKISYSFWEQGRSVPKGWQAFNLALIYLHCKDLFTESNQNQQIEQNLRSLGAIKLFEPEKENLDFGSLCKFIRRTLGVTQEEMAQKLATTAKTYECWEYGKRVPKGWQALNLALIYLYAKEQANKENLANQENDQTPLLKENNNSQI